MERKIKVVWFFILESYRWFKKIFGIASCSFGVISYFVASLTTSMTFKKQCISLSIVLLLMGILSIMMTFIMRKYFKSKPIQVKLNEFSTLTIEKGDLFEAEDNIIIPVNEYFDLQVDNELVNKKTLHGQFILRYFSESTSPLWNMISDDLARQHLPRLYDFIEENQQNKKKTKAIPLKTEVELVLDRPKGNKRKYPLGTTVKVQADNKNFYLVAATHFNENNCANITDFEYKTMLNKLCYYVNELSQEDEANFPMIGCGKAKVATSETFFQDFIPIARSIKNCNVKIVVPENSNMNFWDLKQQILKI